MFHITGLEEMYGVRFDHKLNGALLVRRRDGGVRPMANQRLQIRCKMLTDLMIGLSFSSLTWSGPSGDLRRTTLATSPPEILSLPSSPKLKW